VAFVPAEAVSTEVARGLLPDVVPHRDAAANAARAALLVAALGGRPDLLLRATEDRLHQRYRQPAMPASYALVESLRAQGYAAVISGAGPTVLVLTSEPHEVLGLAPAGWDARHLPVAPVGAREEGDSPTR
jgi:homoserine kinase